MREIKFRGKVRTKGVPILGPCPIEDGEWIYGDLHFRCKFPHIHYGPGLKAPIDPDTIGQYTGLKDADGKEIYEGDLLRFHPANQWEETNYVSFEVFFHDGDCSDSHVGYQMNRAHYHGSICGTTFWPFQSKWTKQMIVEGNIHDNPELIDDKA
jgi:uncharacterized phage protein (TIGR01671 family)